MDEMLYLDVLRKEHTKFYEKIPNIQSYKVKCKCCGADAPYIGSVDFSKTCHDRLGDKVFKNTDLPWLSGKFLQVQKLHPGHSHYADCFVDR